MGEVSTSCWRNDKVWGRWEELESCSDHNLSLENTVGFNSIDKSCKSFPNTLKHEERLSYILYAYLWRENVLRYHTALFGQSRLWRSDVVAQTVKNPPAMWEIWVWSLGWEDRLEEGMATHSSIPAWRIPMDRGAWQATVHGVAKITLMMLCREKMNYSSAVSENKSCWRLVLLCTIILGNCNNHWFNSPHSHRDNRIYAV